MSHDPMLEYDLSLCLNDKAAFIRRIEKSVYDSNVNGLEGQKECLRIAQKCIEENDDVENSNLMSQLVSSIHLHFCNIIQRRLDDN
jgi:hypothetical protein